MPDFPAFALAAIAAALALVPAALGADENRPWIPASLQIGFDAKLSAEVGADDGIALYYAEGRLEDRFLKPRLWSEERFWPHVAGFGYRAARSILIDDPLSSWLSVAQHEVFGHGYRGREDGFRDIEYEVPLPQPYGPGGGLTRWTNRPDTVTLDRIVAISMAGVEAQRVQAERQKLYWTQSGSVDGRGARLYIEGVTSITNYLGVTDESDLEKPDPDLSNDMLEYIWFLNGKEDNRPVADWRLHLRQIKDKSAIMTVIDPFLWYSVWGLVATEYWQGRAYFRYPAVPVGPVRMLPSFGYELGPWGPEYVFEGLFSAAARALSVGYRLGDDTFRRSFGWDAVSLGLLHAGGCILDGDIHYWMQPRLLLEPSQANLRSAARRPGFAGGLNVMSPILPGDLPIRATAAAGWKSSGFVPGKDLGEGAYWRVGLAWTPGSRPTE